MPARGSRTLSARRLSCSGCMARRSPLSSEPRLCGDCRPVASSSLRRRAQARRPVRHAIGTPSSTAPALNAEQLAALAPVLAALARASADARRSLRESRRAHVPAARRHRLRQDRGLPRRRRGGARCRAHRDRPGSGDRTDPPDARPLRGAVRRRRRGDALRACARGAKRRVVASGARRSSGLRRAAVRDLRAAARRSA